MTTTEKTNRYDINLKQPYFTMYSAVAESEERVIEMLSDEIKYDNDYNIEDFEIEYCGKAIDQMGQYFKEELKSEY